MVLHPNSKTYSFLAVLVARDPSHIVRMF